MSRHLQARLAHWGLETKLGKTVSCKMETKRLNKTYCKYFANASDTKYSILVRGLSAMLFVFESITFPPHYSVLIYYITNHSYLYKSNKHNWLE